MECFTNSNKKYARNTIVRLNKDFVKNYCGQDCTIARVCCELDSYYLFALIGTNDPETDWEYIVRVNKNEIEHIVEEIIKSNDAHSVHIEAKQEKYNDWDYTGLIEGWIIYIVFMCLWCIFNDRIGLWILTSVIFFRWRHNKLKPYKKNKK